MKHIFILTALLLGSTAFADGFVCANGDQHLQVSVYNHTAGEQTKRAAAMIFTDTTAPAGQRTIAAFYDDSQALTTSPGHYVATIANNPGDATMLTELIAGVPLAALSEIDLEVAFSNTEPVDAGVAVPAILRLIAHDGSGLQIPVDCTRYVSEQN